MFDHLLQENGDDLLQETGYYILLDRADAQYFWISDTSYEGRMRLDSFSFEEAAEQGQVGTGGFDLDDDSLTVSVPALKAATMSDFRDVSDTRIWTGYTHTRTTERGPMMVAGQRQWGVELLDVNTLLDDDVMTIAGADRGAETDYARVAWLVSTVLTGVSTGVIPNTNTVTMDAVDYRGRKPRELLDQCAEISGKNYFLYADATGIYLYYDLSTGTSLTSTAKISDVATDVDSSTVWAAGPSPSVRRSPDEVYSTVHLTWAGGVVTVTNATTAATYRTREINVLDQGVRTSTTATAKANAFLASSASERTYISDLTVNVPAANVNDFRAGYRLQVKLTRHGISSYTYYRAIRRNIRPAGGDRYLVTLTLLDTLAPTRYLYQRGSNEVWEVKSNASSDGASVIVNRDGITVTDGAISVQDEFSKVTLGASGFSASWADFIKLGIYNGRFTDLTTGALTIGRAATLPYWTLLQGVGSPTFTGLSGGGVTITFSALSDDGGLQSDLVPVRPGSSMEVGYAYKIARSAGTITVKGHVYWYTSSGAASSTPSTQFDSTAYTASVSSLLWDNSSILVPDDATQALMVIRAIESGTHNAANTLTFYAAKLIDLPSSVPYGWNVSPTYVTPGTGTVNNYDPGSINTTPGYLLDPSGALTLTGLVAPSTAARLLLLFNYDAVLTITLKHENASSTAANRFNTPGSVDFVLQPNGGAFLMYDFTSARWLILNKS